MSNKILLVDDDTAMCRTWKDILKEKGFFVQTINHGYLAFLEMKNINYDIVFMDINLTGIDGVKVYKMIKEVRPEIKVVIVTGCMEDKINSLIAQGKSYGMIDEYLRKPVDIENVLDVIKKYT